jgi:hypothetical protein
MDYEGVALGSVRAGQRDGEPAKESDDEVEQLSGDDDERDGETTTNETVYL